MLNLILSPVLLTLCMSISSRFGVICIFFFNLEIVLFEFLFKNRRPLKRSFHSRFKMAR
jgi:hypothetical protein